jgi:hypothetical protein
MRRLNLASRTVPLGQPIAVPSHDGPLYAELREHPTLVHALRSVLYKPAEEHVVFTLADRSLSPYYRFIATDAPDGLLVSNWVSTVDDLTRLMHGGQPNPIIAFRVDGQASQYGRLIDVTFYEEAQG